MASLKVKIEESIALSSDTLLKFINDSLREMAYDVDLSIPVEFWESRDYADALEEIVEILCKKAEDVRQKVKVKEEEKEELTVTEKMLDLWSDFCENTADCDDCPFEYTPKICKKIKG